MNTMNMPGFTADASFYRSSAYYQVSAMFAGPRQGGQVVPSVSRFSSSCVQAMGVRTCATCVGELGCYVCFGPVVGGSHACFWEGGTN
jgi:hypothetical protein